MEDRLDAVIGASVAALVGIVLVCAMVIPVGLQFINKLDDTDADGHALIEGGSDFMPLLMVVIFTVILALIVGVIRFFQNRR